MRSKHKGRGKKGQMVLYRRGEEVASLGIVISSMDLDISDETSKDKWYGVSDR
jgi:hypothetical protein